MIKRLWPDLDPLSVWTVVIFTVLICIYEVFVAPWQRGSMLNAHHTIRGTI